MNERSHCTCHNISRAEFVYACEHGANNVKTCFKKFGCLPKCSNCIPLVKQVIKEYQLTLSTKIKPKLPTTQPYKAVTFTL